MTNIPCVASEYGRKQLKGVLDLGQVEQPVRRGAVLQCHRHEGPEGGDACDHALLPLIRVDAGEGGHVHLRLSPGAGSAHAGDLLECT